MLKKLKQICKILEKGWRKKHRCAFQLMKKTILTLPYLYSYLDELVGLNYCLEILVQSRPFLWNSSPSHMARGSSTSVASLPTGRHKCPFKAVGGCNLHFLHCSWPILLRGMEGRAGPSSTSSLILLGSCIRTSKLILYYCSYSLGTLLFALPRDIDHPQQHFHPGTQPNRLMFHPHPSIPLGLPSITAWG